MAVTFKLLRKYVNSDELQNNVLIIDTEHKKGEIVSKDYFLNNNLLISGNVFIYQLPETTLITNKKVNMKESNSELITFEEGVTGVFIANDDAYEYLEGELLELYKGVFLREEYIPVGDLHPNDYDTNIDYAYDWWEYVSSHYHYEMLEDDVVRINIPDIEGKENITKVIFN